MKPRHADRRRSERVPASNTVSLRRPSGELVAHGRASNISETGMLAVVRQGEQAAIGDEIVAEVDLRGDAASVRQAPSGVYRCRVVRIIRSGSLMGFGLEFILPPAD